MPYLSTFFLVNSKSLTVLFDNSSLKEALVSIGALKEDEDIKKEHIELFAKLVKDNKKLYQEPDKALESEKLIVIPFEDLPNND